jgi:phosphopantetheinyl transferase (holo-ACP synthase)
MVGNDLVDLSDRETSAAEIHPRFDTRVFTAEELAVLHGSAAPARLRWILWAAKEAAYKLARKEAPVVFSPRRFRTALAGSGRAVVTHAGRSFAVTIAVRRDHVHAVACSGPVRRGWTLVSGVRRLGAAAPGGPAPDPGVAVRAFTIARLARRLGVAAAELSIEREGRIPRLVLRGRPAGADLSLSHHGGLVGFACELDLRRGSPAVSR